jgi:transposase-like protein
LFIRRWLGKLMVAVRQQPEPRLRMNHKNARTPPYSRLAIARRVDAGEKVARVAADFSVSEQTLRKRVWRWRAGGALKIAHRKLTLDQTLLSAKNVSASF